MASPGKRLRTCFAHVQTVRGPGGVVFVCPYGGRRREQAFGASRSGQGPGASSAMRWRPGLRENAGRGREGGNEPCPDHTLRNAEYRAHLPHGISTGISFCMPHKRPGLSSPGLLEVALVADYIHHVHQMPPFHWLWSMVRL